MEIKGLFSLKGKTAVVTGGAGKIGRYMIRGLCEAGAECIILSRNKDKSMGFINEMKQNKYSVEHYKCDISREEEVIKAKQHYSSNKNIRILVNNSAYTVCKDIFSLTVEDWQKTYEVNLLGSFLCTKYFGSLIKKMEAGV